MSKNSLSSLGIQIKGMGHYYPEKILTDEEIRSRLKYPEMHPAERAVIGDIGVTKRFRSNEKETSIYMAAEASKKAMKDANVSPESVDLYLFCNWTERYYLPDLAPQASIESGTQQALAFDVGTACAGFIAGVQTASMYLLSGRYKRAIVVGSERFSIRTKMGGYGEFTAGDAAAAVVLDYTGDKSSGIIDFYLKDEGTLHDTMVISEKGIIKSFPHLVTNAADLTLKGIDLLLKKNNLSPEDIDWLVPHPGTDIVLQDVLKRSPIPTEKTLINFDHVGNTSAASIPTILSEYRDKFKKGDLILAPAVGGGFFWGGILFTF
ncbi:MAG: ketoacyl-ACP synthase III [Leptospiraceae bacterium]|nr:ketoacyl-ACP synthase III [Leptospiraceae bacterium]MCP5513187.1 ketoacyl-ACP synthase III [Leptospiraceae bacterium]